MADVGALASTFQRAGLTAPVYHELTFNFPATELLPAGKRPHLEPPTDVAYREKPTFEAYRRPLANFADLDFYHQVRVERSAIPASQPPDDSKSGSLREAVERLSGAAGRSSLGVVAFLDQDGEPVYYMRLSTTWNLGSREVNEVKDLCYAGIEWALELALGGGEPWLELLQGLVERSSVRAYFHVLHALSQYDVDFMEHEQRRWDEQWQSVLPRSPSGTLCQKLQSLHDDGDGEFFRLPITTIHGYSPDDELWILLPCGHSDAARASVLQNATGAEAIHFACRECGQYVLGRADVHAVRLGMQKDGRSLFLELQEMLAECDAAITGNEGVVTIMKSTTLLDALDTTLRSLQAPSSITPTPLCPSSLPEMDPVQSALRRAVASEGAMFAITPQAICGKLLLTAYSALNGEVSTRFAPFLMRWLMRAVNYAIWTDAKGTATVEAKKEMDEMAELMRGMTVRQDEEEARAE